MFNKIILLLSHQLATLEEEKLSLTQTVSDLAATKENLSKEVEELLARNQSLEKKLTASKGQVIIKLPSPFNLADGEFPLIKYMENNGRRLM